MPSSDLQPPTHLTTHRRRWGGAFVGAVIGAVGLGLVSAPVLAPDAGDPLLLVATGVAMLATAAAMEIGALWLPRPASAVTSESGVGGTTQVSGCAPRCPGRWPS